jgi:hypothetical protein
MSHTQSDGSMSFNGNGIKSKKTGKNGIGAVFNQSYLNLISMILMRMVCMVYSTID